MALGRAQYPEALAVTVPVPQPFPIHVETLAAPTRFSVQRPVRLANIGRDLLPVVPFCMGAIPWGRTGRQTNAVALALSSAIGWWIQLVIPGRFGSPVEDSSNTH